jgi:hypothetical protein
MSLQAGNTASADNLFGTFGMPVPWQRNLMVLAAPLSFSYVNVVQMVIE